MQTFKQSQAIDTAFRQILKTREEAIKQKILQDFTNLAEFVKSARINKSLIIKYIPKENEEAIKKILEKKKKNEELKQNIKIKCLEEDGIKRIKKIFNFDDKNILITYISAGNFKLKLSVEDFKEGKKRMTEILEELEKRAKENNCEFFASEDK